MSRIGNRILKIAEGVEVTVDNQLVTVKGPKGELQLEVKSPIKVEVKDGEVYTTRPNDTKQNKQLHGTTNSLINNMLIGVKDGYTQDLETIGVGYRFNVAGQKIGINAGFSHPVEIEIPSDLKVTQTSNTEISISGISKKKVADFAAKIRAIRPPEPYKGKGIRYKGEHVRRKVGKKAAK
ncbi:MAG: 50S ribosomal protein L6 [Bacilli bacterium]|nr:50S ribosomal protein L6 [Bacilli bacterium]